MRAGVAADAHGGDAVLQGARGGHVAWRLHRRHRHVVRRLHLRRAAAAGVKHSFHKM